MVGDPMESGTLVGALISKEHLAKVKGYIKLARDEGCKIAYEANLKLPERNQQVSYPGILGNAIRSPLCGIELIRHRL